MPVSDPPGLITNHRSLPGEPPSGGSSALGARPWYLNHESLGRVPVGRINTKTAGLTTVDLGCAGVIANANIGCTQCGFSLALNDNLLTSTWANALRGNPVNGSGLSRAKASATPRRPSVACRCRSLGRE